MSNVAYICKLYQTFEEVKEYGPGAFMFNRVGNIVIHTPDGSILDWNITVPNFRPYWVFDGNRERPTLVPDLIVRLKRYGTIPADVFHGRLAKGVLHWRP